MSHAFQADGPPETTEAFPAWPGDGRAKSHHLVDGRVVAMSPGSATRGLIQMTLGRLIGQRLIETESGRLVLSEVAVVPRVRADVNARVPDLVVTCSPIAAGRIAVADPMLLVGILSPSNASQTWSNVWTYSTIPSVREILVVHSTRMRAHLLRRPPTPCGPTCRPMSRRMGRSASKRSTSPVRWPPSTPARTWFERVLRRRRDGVATTASGQRSPSFPTEDEARRQGARRGRGSATARPRRRNPRSPPRLP